MLRAPKVTVKRRRVRFPGICTHADLLGVTREHLWQVLSGRRESRRLMKRYLELTKKEEA